MSEAAGERRYCPFYCEENVWWAAEDVPPGSKVVFVSNAKRAVALCFQRAARDGIGPVVWDYHVILLVPGPGQADDDAWVVIDLDTTLGERVPATEYLDRTFLALEQLPPELHPRFRVIDAAEYRTRLSSDRSHMRREDGGWTAAPPAWDPIGDPPANLMRFVDLDDAFVGEVMGFEALRSRFA
jgi:hypothetical protein